MSSRCLLITGVFPPAGGAGAVRLAKLCTHLPRHGWEVDVVAPRDGGGWNRDESLAQEVSASAVARVWTPGGGRWLGGWRARAKAGERTSTSRAVLGLARAARTLRNQLAVPDEHLASVPFFLGAAVASARANGTRVLWTSSPPASHHLVGLLLKRATGLPWVAELRDPWVGNPWRGEPGPLRRWLDPWLERRVVDAADALVVLSPGMADALARRYGADAGARMEVVTNGFDAEDFGDGEVPRVDGAAELLYVGSFSSALTPPDAVLAAMAALGRREPALAPRLRLRVVGSADLEAAAALRAYAAGHDSPVVSFDRFVPHRQATRMMRETDALLLVLAEGTPWVLTSKVFEYLGSGRPIVAVVPEGDCRTLLARSGGSVSCAPGDVERLTGLLRTLACGEPLPLDRAPQPDEIARYAWPEVARAFAATLDRASRR